MSSDDWKSLAEASVARIFQHLRASITSRPLNDKLVEFRIHPDASDATDVTLVVSASDVILGAGRGMQVELPAFPEAEPRLSEIIRAIADGDLTESIRNGFVQYRLVLSDGSTLEGRMMKSLPLGRQESISYSPYGSK
jgi:hypothetical protein